jgi:hypothetical protein
MCDVGGSERVKTQMRVALWAELHVVEGERESETQLTREWLQQNIMMFVAYVMFIFLCYENLGEGRTLPQNICAERIRPSIVKIWLDLGVYKARIQGSFQLMFVQILSNEHKLVDAPLSFFPRLPNAFLTGTELPHVMHALEHGPAEATTRLCPICSPVEQFEEDMKVK